MNAFCFASPGLRGIASGLRYSRPRRGSARDQSRAAFVDEAECLLDPGAGPACRTRQRRACPRRQIVLLLRTQAARAAARIKTGDAFDPALFEELAPAGGSCRRPTTMHGRLAGSSIRRPKAPSRSRAASPGKARTHRAPAPQAPCGAEQTYASFSGARAGANQPIRGHRGAVPSSRRRLVTVTQSYILQL